MDKIFWFDTETGGLDPETDSLLTISGMVEVDGEIEEKFDLKMRPDPHLNVTDQALEVTGLTREEIAEWPPEEDAWSKLFKLLTNQVDKFNSGDKLIPAGYNVRFDVDFLEKFWERNKGKKDYLGSFFERRYALDPFMVFPFLMRAGFYNAPKTMKLKDLADHLGIEYDEEILHTSMGDIELTRKVVSNLEFSIWEEIRKEAQEVKI